MIPFMCRLNTLVCVISICINTERYYRYCDGVLLMHDYVMIGMCRWERRLVLIGTLAPTFMLLSTQDIPAHPWER